MDIHVSQLEMRLPGQTSPLFRLPSLQVASGSRLLIHGPSGSGKTTLLHLLCGQFLPHAGSIRVGESELTALSASARARFRRERCGIIFQRANLIEHFTALENIEIGVSDLMDTQEKATQEKATQEKATQEKALWAAENVGVAHLANQRAGLLSPGEQQRVAVARICASVAGAAPALILADEPTSSLDLPGTEKVMEALWQASAGKTLVVVSHDPRIQSRFRQFDKCDIRDFTDLISTDDISAGGGDAA